MSAEALRRWRLKLDRLLEAEAIETDASERVRLEVQIGEARAKIAELEGQCGPSPATPRAGKPEAAISGTGTGAPVGQTEAAPRDKGNPAPVVRSRKLRRLVGASLVGFAVVWAAYIGFTQKDATAARDTADLCLDRDTKADCPKAPLPTGGVLGPGRTALATTEMPMTFVRLAAGSFNMGGCTFDDEKPCHRVELNSFEIASHEVTNEQWRIVMKTEPPGSCRGECLKTAPVTSVRWDDAIDFVNQLSLKEFLPECYSRDQRGRVKWIRACAGYRLPTEAEWEYATRAGTVGEYSFEGGQAELETYAWFRSSDDSGASAQAVGQKKPNPWGLYDVHGNVAEWVWDKYAPYPADLIRNDLATVDVSLDNSRVLRGGSYLDRPIILRSATRIKGDPSRQLVFYGFRVARNAVP